MPSAGASGGAGAPDWPRIARQLSTRYGWTPEEIAALTLNQLQAYLADDGQGEDEGSSFALWYERELRKATGAGA